jgi:tetratricopeptide (TPR) repeat protein
MASAAYNLAKLHERSGDSDQARLNQQQALSSLKEAFRLRTQLVDRLTRLEVQADHALMVTRDIEEAVRLYEEILQFSEASPLRPALRAHWMLMGIHLGAWQIDATHPNLVQPDRAREHLLRILAFWPASSEAAAVKRFVLWDEKAGRSRTPYLPVDSQPLAVAESAGN